MLTTNVAETSLTVPRIRFVIDSGLARISRYAHRSRIQQLPIEPVSRASADQRMGRCGRLGPGTCVRLYSEEDYLQRPEFTEPEILRTSLASVILRMLTMGLGAVEEFPFIDPPAPRMIREAYQLLFELGALDAANEPTPLGRRLARWPVDVRLARMIEEGAEQGCLEDLLVLAAGLSIQDPRERPLEAQSAADEAHARFADERSDFVALLQLWEYLRRQRRQHGGGRFRRLCRQEFLAWQRVMEWFDLYQQLRDQAREQGLPLRGGHGDYGQVHRALLAGLLGQVGRKDPEGHGYTGARNRSYHVFPGSGLFRRAPRWLMSAEIVETSRPFARMNARIEPEWVEAQAAHLLKRHYHDPHWSRRRGRVMAWEQVTLYGLVLVERRHVSFAEVDPAESRRIFILEALVRGELDLAARFLDENRRLREALERIEHKRRQRDVLADERDLFDFYDARLPAEIHSAATLESWLREQGEDGLRRLRMGQDVMLREEAGDAPAEQYPDALEVAGRRFSLAYRFEPGDPEDGVTLRTPLELLNTLDAARLSWLVPGLLREKLVELMKTLPKPTRRALTPLPRFADAALQRLGAPGDEPLAEALARALSEVAGVTISVKDLDEAQLEPHLRLRVEVVDDSGQVLAASRDLQALQERFGSRAQARFMHRQGADMNRDGETGWAFGTLPRTVTTGDGVEAWPA
ncbi:MAG: ATP-dependent RNA helicase HrpA, partial [Gammaproteobacteria bacterium]